MALEIFDILTYDFAEDDSASTPALIGIVTSTATITNSPIEDAAGYTDLLTATSVDERPAGTYEFGFSMNWLGNFAQDKVLIAFKRVGASTWNVSPHEPKDPESKNLTVYTFPYTITVPTILTLELQVALFDDGNIAGNQLDIYFVNAWIKRVS